LPAIPRLPHTTDAVVALPLEAVQPLCDSGFLAVLASNLGVGMGPFGIITRRKHKLSAGAQALFDAIRASARALYCPTRLPADGSDEPLPLPA
jgi:hypothetical protein